VVLKILKLPVKVIVVDDGSTDDTAAIARAAGATVIRHEKNLGKGEALNSGFCKARELQPAAIVMIDGDGQHLPEQLVDLVQPVLHGEADLVIGSRYLQKDNQVPRHRLLGHRFFNLLTSAASGVNVTDSQSGYRAFSPKAYNSELFHCSDFSVESEMQFLAHEHHLRVVEVPITIRYLEKPKRPVWQQGLVVLGGVLRLAGQYRPLLFFGLPGLILALTGIAMGCWVVERFLEVRQVAVGTAFGSMVFLMTGLIMFSTGIILHSVRGLLSETLHGYFHDNCRR
jgi:glycosyltransferase involved in cell wall biosynthesis